MQGLLLLALMATGLIFFLQNRQPIQLNFLGTTAQSALASFTLPLGLWVVIFLTLGVFTSLVINILSAIGQPKPRPQPQTFRSDPPRRSPRDPLDGAPMPPFEPNFPKSPNSAPRKRPEPEPVIQDNDEWDWDDPVPDLADWGGEKPEPRPKRQVEVKDTPRSPAPRAKSTPEEIDLPETDPLHQDRTDSDFTDQDDLPDLIEQPEPVAREPLPDLRQFEVPQTPKSTQREGTIYSQQYRSARPSQPKSPDQPKVKPESPSNSIYDVPYRVINSGSSSQADSEDKFNEEEDWI